MKKEQLAFNFDTVPYGPKLWSLH